MPTLTRLFHLSVGLLCLLPLHASLPLPLVFEPDPGGGYLLRGQAGALLIHETDALLSDGKSTIGMRLIGADAAAKITPLDPLPGVSHYLLGGQSERTARQYGRVRIANVYPGIDVIYYARGQRLEYDLVVAPGADPSRIVIEYSGAEPRIENGALTIGKLRWDAPRIYQDGQGSGAEPESVEGGYELHGRKATFRIANYDRRRPLIIDPTLSFATFLSGYNDNRAMATAIGADGNVVVAGYTSAPNFPLQTPAYSTYAGGLDAFVARLNPAGTTLLSSTYIGGSGDDQINGVAVDGAGNIWVAGTTSSSNLPTRNPVYASPGGGTDAFLMELNGQGSALLFSTYIGGSANETGDAVAAQGNSFACLTGQTQSFDFPTRNAYQASRSGSSDAFVGCYDGAAFRYLTLLGGSADEEGRGIALDGAQNAYVAGSTTSTNFPLSAPLQATRKGSQTAFVTKFRSDGLALTYSTYLGGGSYDTAFAIAVDLAGSAYVTGETYSLDFPTTTGAFQTVSGGFDAVFVSKLNPAGSALTYSTYLSGSGNDLGYAISVDPIGNAHVVGLTASPDFPVSNAIQSKLIGGAQRMYRSSDSGQTWADISGTLPVQLINNVAVSPTDANTAWVSTCPGVWKTTDGGATWNQVGSTQPPISYACVNAVAVSPVNSNLLIAGTSSSGAFTSPDGGTTWTQIAQGTIGNVDSIIFNSTGTTAYAGADGGAIYVIPTGAMTVSQTLHAGSASVERLALDPANGNHIFAATSSGIYLTTNASSFSLLGNGIPANSGGLSVFTQPGAAYAGTGCGLYKSVDGGTTWTGINSGLDNNCVWSMAATGGSLLAATLAPGVYRSTNGGANWTVTSGIQSFTVWLTVAPSNPTVVYATAFPGEDSFITKLNPLGTGLIYSTYLGAGTGYEQANGVATTNTDAYVAGWTGNAPLGPPFPVTPGAFQTAHGGYNDAYVVRLNDSSCSYSLSGSAVTAVAPGLAGTLTLSTGAACQWITMTNVPWIVVTTAQSGTGNATVSYQILPNTTTSARSGTMSIGGQMFTVSQAAGTSCSYVLSGNTLTPGGSAVVASIQVTAGVGCAWTATSAATWISLPAGGTGPGYANFSFAANTTGASRVGSITLAGQTVTVTQAAIACIFTVSPSAVYTLAASSLTILSITANTTGCSWTTSNAVSWITLTPPSGTGSSVNLVVSTNTGAARTGTVTIAGQTVTVTQDGTGVVLPTYFNFTSQNIPVNPQVADGRLMDLGYAGPTLVLAQNLLGPPVGMLAAGSDGTGKFTTDLTATVFGNSPPTTMWWRDFALADFNGDGREDLLVSDTGPDAAPFPGGQNHLLLQTANGMLNDVTATNLPQELGFSHSVAAGDIDGNGSMDLYIGNIYSSAGCGGELWLNNGSGVFTKNSSGLPAAVTNCTMKFNTARFADVDKNGTLDLVLGGAPDSSTVAQPRDTILLNDGHGNFHFAPDSAMPLRLGGATWTTWGMAIADLDNDGWPDIIALMVDSGVSVTKMQLLLNNQDGTFRDASTRVPNDWTAGGGFLEFATAVDLNGDGYLDLLIRANNTNGSVLLNTGQGQFVRVNDLLPLPAGLSWNGSRWMFARDLNHDTKPDLVINQSNVSTTAVGLNTNPLPQVGACGFGLSSNTYTAPAAGGTTSVNVTAGKTCRWLASTEAGWITIDSGMSNGPGVGSITVAPSISGQTRSATVLMAGQALAVTQTGLACSYLLNASALSVAMSGATGQVGITTSPADCTWSASSNASWITPTANASQGLGTVSFTVDGNLTGAPRSGTVTIGGVTFTVNQDGTPPAALSISKSHSGSFSQGQNGATYTVKVSNGAAAGATSGTVTVSETLPTGLTLVSMAGTGWTCSGGPTCFRNDVLNANASYQDLTVTVNVGNAASPVTNQVSVSGGGSASASTSDITSIAAFTCDLNGDQAVTVADVQMMIGEALGAAPVHDLNHDGLVNAADVRKAINSALGLGCVY